MDYTCVPGSVLAVFFEELKTVSVPILADLSHDLQQKNKLKGRQTCQTEATNTAFHTHLPVSHNTHLRYTNSARYSPYRVHQTGWPARPIDMHSYTIVLTLKALYSVKGGNSPKPPCAAPTLVIRGSHSVPEVERERVKAG